MLMVQFEHRMVAYALFFTALWHLIDVRRGETGATVVGGAAWLAIAVTAQAALGIVTLLNQAPLDLALSHQAAALVVVVLAVAQLERLTPPPRSAPAPTLNLAETAP
jgi:cytochrome c oxidase assembly protein subunit 15